MEPMTPLGMRKITESQANDGRAPPLRRDRRRKRPFALQQTASLHLCYWASVRPVLHRIFVIGHRNHHAALSPEATFPGLPYRRSGAVARDRLRSRRSTAETKPALVLSQVPDIDPSTYRVGAEDMLEISVWREDALKKEALVRPDGGISYPLIGEVQVAGKDRVRDSRRDRKAPREVHPRARRSRWPSSRSAASAFTLSARSTNQETSRWADTWTFSRRSAWRAASRRSRTRTTFASCAAMASVRSCFRSSTAASCAGRNSSRTFSLRAGDVVVVP